MTRLRAKDKLLFVVTIALAACAVGLTWLNAVRIADRSRPPEPTAYVPNWQKYTGLGSRIGSDPAPVTIVEFLDYRCGACKSFATTLDKVLAGTQVALVDRHFPIGGVESEIAARSAVCADTEGVFLRYHEILLSERAFRVDSLLSYASRAGIVDVPRFRACVDSDAARAVVARDVAATRRQ
jgi:protein-disulfide isomerase